MQFDTMTDLNLATGNSGRNDSEDFYYDYFEVGLGFKKSPHKFEVRMRR